MRRLGLVCLLFAAAAAAADCEQPLDVAALGAQVHTPAVWSAAFRQSNHLKVISRPLESSGRVYVDQAQGLVWQVRAPIQNDLVITRSGVDQGRGVVPSTQLIGQLLRDLVGGDVERLTERFEVRACVHADGWRAVLEPKDAFLAERIAQFRLIGATTVAAIEFDQLSGNWTRIDFDSPEAMDALPGPIADLLVD